jgi:hypothetical protein
LPKKVFDKEMSAPKSLNKERRRGHVRESGLLAKNKDGRRP